MKRTEYERLTLSGKMNALQRDGVFVAKEKWGNATTMLYQLEGFYVEIFYSNYRREVASLRVTDDPRILDRYLASESIGELISF